MKKHRIICLALGIFFAIACLSPLALPSIVKANAILTLPTLRVTIISPANNAAFKAGANFTITARITNEGPGVAPFVYAVISAGGTGSASMPDPSPVWQMNEGESRTVSFGAHYNGGGKATFVVCPRGPVNVTGSQEFLVCAIGGPDGIIPSGNESIFFQGEYPADHLICGSVTIRESSSSDVSPSVSSGPGSSGLQGTNVLVTNLFAQPQLAAAGQEITIFGNVTNRGDVAGSYNATLKINGQVETVRTGTIGANVAVPLKFTLSRETQGTYEVDLNGQKTFFTVTGAVSPNQLDGRIIAAIGLAIIVVVLAVMIVRRHSEANR
jgi:hypothetical protein